MKISDFSIRHPAIIGIVLISLGLFGIISFRGIPRDLMANIEMPEVLVLSIQPGASPEVVERDVTDVLEEEFSLIEGIRKISSESQDGFSMIFLTLDWNADIEAKKNDIRDKINNAMADLPDNLAGTPSLFELGTSSLPVYSCIVESDLDESEFARILNDELVPLFSRLTDVSAVYARGIEEPVVRVTLDPGKLDSMDISALEAYAALKGGQASIPAGFVLLGADRITIQSEADYQSLYEIGLQPVSYGAEGIPIYLKDIAEIGMGNENPEFRTLSDGKREVALDIMKRPGGDTDSLVSEVRRLQIRIEEESDGLIRFSPILDNAETIGITLRSVSQSAWLGGLLAVIVLLIFLHNIRAALIVTLSIPFTVFLTFILMRARGMSLNIMSLAGITVSIGMIVDASIVILENTVRHRNTGLNAVESASKGAGEVTGAVLASTSTSLSVFVPILFLSGLAGAILKEVSWVLVFSLASSAVTAVLVVPWLSAHLPEFSRKTSLLFRFGRVFDVAFKVVSRRYSVFLEAVLNHKKYLIALSAFLVAASLVVLATLGGELFSAPDMNEFEVRVRLPSGYNLEKAESKIAEIASLTRAEIPEIEADLWYAGLGDSATIIDSGNPSEGYGRVRLTRTLDRKRSVFEIVRHLNKVLPAAITDADITVRNGGLAKQMNYATDGAGFRVEVSGSEWGAVLEAAEGVRLLLESDPMIGRASFNVRLDRELIGVDMDRISAGRLGINPVHAGQNLRILFAGEDSGTLRSSGESYSIFIDSSLAGDTLGPGILGRIHVKNISGKSVPYSAFATLERRPSTDSIPHTDRLPSLVVVGELLESDVAGIQSRIEPALRLASLPLGVSWRIAGVADVMGDTFRDLATALGIAIFLVYAVMVIQFERFTQPFIIMGAVPFVLIGVAASLAAFGGRITMMSFFGIIALGGMVVNNAIVLVEFMNQRRREGLGIREAVLEAARVRLKPILMTTLTTVLGLIPLAFSLGEGSQIYAALGQVIGGGLITSTLITLVLVPALYELFELRREQMTGKRTAPERKTRGQVGGSVLPLVILAGLMFLTPGFRLHAQESGPWTINELIARAMSDDPELSAAREETRSANARLKGARAERGPVVDLELGTSYLSDAILSVPAGALGELPPALGGTPIPDSDIDVWGQANDFRYDVAAILEQPIYTWGKISSGIDAAEAGSSAAGWRARSREEDLKSGIIIAVESLVLIDRMLELTARQVDLGDRLAELTLRNFEEGFLLETEYRDTRNRLQQILLTETALRNERKNLLLNIEQVTGLRGLDTDTILLPPVDDSLEAYAIGTPEELIRAAWSYNPDIKTLSSLEDLAQAELGLAKGGLAVKPDLAFRTEFGYGGGFGGSPDALDGTWRLTIGAVSTLVDSGRSRSGIRSAEALLDAAGSRTESARRQIETFIRSTLYSMSLNRANIEYYVGLREADSARAAQHKSSWETGYGREEQWLLAELDSLASELSRYREVLQYVRSDRLVRQAAGLLN